ncbi:MAG: hypothetical protein ACYC5N_10380 [Endomicrobiales bacterium]
MYIVRFLGTFAIIPATLLLTTSFFVLMAVQSIQVPGLRVFGYFVAVLLWLTAALILFVGFFALFTGRNPLKPVLQHMMKAQMQDSYGQGSHL